MGCCGSTSLSEPSLTYTVELYEIQSADKSYSYKFEKRSSETIEKQEESTIENDLNGCGNNLISNITSDTTIQQNSMFYLYIGRDLIFKNYKDIYQILPYKYPTLVKIIVILINEAINDGIEKDLIKKGIELLDNFPKGIINLEKIKEKYDISQNPNITNDNLNLSDDDNSENDDELIIDEEDITEKTLSEINTYLFNPIDNEKNNANDDDIVQNQKDKIKKIVFQNCKFPDIYTFSIILSNLEKYKNLKKFSFNNNYINSDFEGYSSIIQLLNNNYNIRIVDLKASSLNDYQLDKIVDSIKDKRLRSLDLSENFLTSEGMKFLSKFLKDNKTLQRLYVQRNAVIQFKAEGVKHICLNLLDHPNILLLDFSYMELTGCGEFIGQFLSENKTLEILNIISCKLNITDFKNICGPICNNKKLKKFSISQNDMGGIKSLEEVGKVIKNNKSIVEIHLAQMNLNMDNYQIIFDAIDNNKTIKHYDLSNNYDLKPKLVLNFFFKKHGIECLEYIPYNPEKHPGKELTLEEKKLIEKFKNEKPEMKLITK
jgi:hypothetical protein